MSSYVDDSLIPGERVVKRAQLSLMVYAGSGTWLLLFIADLVYVIMAGGLLGWYECLIPLFFFVSGILGTMLRVRSTELAVTNKRVLAKTGFISCSTVELNLTALESVLLTQGVLGRILNYGDLAFKGTGNVTVPISYVSHPLEFKREVMAVSDAAKNRAS